MFDGKGADMATEFQLDETVIDQVASLPAVRQAVRAAAELIALWPLTDATRMDNDAKYAENLQVRITRTMAAMMTGEDVTMPDAEYVYEGADWIPGRPQTIVDALLAANDAYDTMADYSETGDVALVADAAGILRGAIDDGDGRDADAPAVRSDDAGVRAVLEGVEALIAPKATDDGHVPQSGDEDEIAHRFAIVIVACDALFRTLAGRGAADAVRVLPVILYANELGERLAIPRVCMDTEAFRGLLDAVSGADDAATALAGIVAPLAAAEWTKHREEVLWDPEEAKKRAKEEDERKSKEALAAKFAHVKDDPNKEPVEL